MKTIATTAMMLTASLFASTANADHARINELACAIKQHAALACQEVRFGFNRTAAFPHLYKDFYDLYVLADHIHEVAQNHGDLCHLKDDVAQINALFHHTEILITPFQAGQGGCSVSGIHLRRLVGLMGTMEEKIHCLQADLNAHLAPLPVPPVVPGAPIPPDQLGQPGLPHGGHLGQPALPTLPSPGFVPHQTRHRSFPGGNRWGISNRNGKVAFSIQLGR